MKNPWKINAVETKYQNAWIEVKHHEVLNPAGNDGVYGVVSFKNLAIGVVPLDAELQTYLVGQFRFPLNAYSWEIPEGGCLIGVEEPLDAAKRELLEEVGLKAQKWTEIGQIHTSNSVCDEAGLIFLAQDLEQTMAEPEETEELVIKKLPISEAIDMVMKGEITDSISTTALLKVGRLLQI